MKSSLACALVLSATAACSSTSEPNPSGFLGESYADMKLDPDTGNLIYRKAGVDLSQYTKVMLDPVEVWVDTEDRYRGAAWVDVRRVADLCGSSMRAALEGGYPVVEEDGPDVLRIRLAVTGVQADVDGYSTRENLGYGDPDTVDQISETGTGLDIETISVEADFVDSATGDRLIAALVRRSAKPVDGETSWDAVNEVFRKMAQRVRLGLDKAHTGN